MILVLRPQPQLQQTLQACQAQGLNATGFPIATITPTPYTVPPQATTLILTSQQAVTPHLPNLPAICVGQATAQAARAHGLTVLATGQGNGADLVPLILQEFPEKQHFLHPHASNAGREWHPLLQRAGHTVTGVQAYTTTYLPTLTPEQQKAAQTAGHTLLFSPGAATNYTKLLHTHGIQPGGKAVCLSPAVAKAAQAFPHVWAPPTPNLQLMLEYLKQEKNHVPQPDA